MNKNVSRIERNMSKETENIEAVNIDQEAGRALGRERIQLTYQQCVEHTNNWEALGRNYTAVHKGHSGVRLHSYAE
jgi:hypothetical protein